MKQIICSHVKPDLSPAVRRCFETRYSMPPYQNGQDFYFDILLTAHLSITLANDKLDAQFLYFIIRLLQSSTCFEQRRAHHQEVKLY